VVATIVVPAKQPAGPFQRTWHRVGEAAVVPKLMLYLQIHFLTVYENRTVARTLLYHIPPPQAIGSLARTVLNNWEIVCAP
jgi:hypothetical protein